MSRLLGHDLGSYLREQRESAQLSLRQLADLAGISNPYLSQIERGLKKPSAEILQQIARGLQVSAESLYVRAGILEDREPSSTAGLTVRAAIAADHRLNDRQRSILIDVYESFVGTDASGSDTRSPAASSQPAAAPASGARKAAPAADPDAAPSTPRGAKPPRSTTRRRKPSAPAVPLAPALTTRRSTPSRPTDRDHTKE